MKIIVTMDWGNRPEMVGTLEVFRTRGAENYQFTYARLWRSGGRLPDKTA